MVKDIEKDTKKYLQDYKVIEIFQVKYCYFCLFNK